MISRSSRTAPLVVAPTAVTLLHRDLVITLAARHRLPAIYPYRFFATGGGFISYGIDLVEQYRQAAGYVDRILKGAKPGELPVQLSSKFELVVNLKTAKALGLAIPEPFLQRADEVIE
jgi:putative ABC transport system substrate-binding protein